MSINALYKGEKCKNVIFLFNFVMPLNNLD